ncbi:hypothetical protein ODV17_05745 [Lactobacillus amylovorus]|nr:hypothetical protein [Lactobacillus amylovorus]MDB6239537.1 hypothetical protein [Lactobacillus amylovorus]
MHVITHNYLSQQANGLINIVYSYLMYLNKCVKSSVIELDHRMILDTAPLWGERLLTVFIITNNLKYKEYHIRYANKTINIGRKIARILHINKNSSFYIKLQKNTVQNLHIKDRKDFAYWSRNCFT